MSDRVRMSVFAVALGGLLGLMLWGFAGLPDFGDYRGPYGEILNRVAVPERSTTDVVTAVNFDYRGFDTLDRGVHPVRGRDRCGEHPAQAARASARGGRTTMRRAGTCPTRACRCA